jgi:hypothetical protein
VSDEATSRPICVLLALSPKLARQMASALLSLIRLVAFYLSTPNRPRQLQQPREL